MFQHQTEILGVLTIEFAHRQPSGAYEPHPRPHELNKSWNGSFRRQVCGNVHFVFHQCEQNTKRDAVFPVHAHLCSPHFLCKYPATVPASIATSAEQQNFTASPSKLTGGAAEMEKQQSFSIESSYWSTTFYLPTFSDYSFSQTKVAQTPRLTPHSTPGWQSGE